VRIAEIYRSWQGEGLLTGTPSIFIRTSGCNLRCWFCDTPHTSWQPSGEQWSLEGILDEVQRLDCEHVVITGGEPLLPQEITPLCERLDELGKHITIETAGTQFRPVRCRLMSISPKLQGSAPDIGEHPRWHHLHQARRHQPQVVSQLMQLAPYQLKFVIDTPEDCQQVVQYIALLPQVDHQRVLLMPQGTNAEELDRRAQWLRPWCHQHGFVFCERAHIRWFGHQPRT
jgi:7-carboxy-7-deazaguanine synthase